ncbi:MAG TPA: glucose dehydrogenase, partial [Cytophagaceae bacterium]
MENFLIKANLTLIGVFAMLTSCYKIPGSYGYKKLPASLNRNFNAQDIAVPSGYGVELFCKDLTFPTAIAFDEDGAAYTIESGYSYGEEFTESRLLRISDGKLTEVAKGSKNGPWTGLQYYKGNFYVAEGGILEGGKILKISKDGNIQTLVDSLPTLGDHHTNGPVIGPDNYLYFSLGTATNSGVVGKDNYKYGWLKRFPNFHDIPCADITLNGVNYKTDNPLTETKDDKVSTGAYLPFGTPS